MKYSWDHDWKITPRTPEEIKACETPQGKRQRLHEARYYDPLVRGAFDLGPALGLHELDVLTVLAFEALVQREMLIDCQLEFLQRNPMPPLFVKAKP